MARVMPEGWGLPPIDDLSRAFFTSGKVLVQECTACGSVQHPPEHVCCRCQASDFRSRELRGTGTVYSYTIVHHPVHPMLETAVPYAVALISLDELPEVRITGNVLGCEPSEISIGQPVRAVWEQIHDETSGETLQLPQWEPIE